MSSDHIPFEGTPEPSVETRLEGLDDTFLELLRGKWSASAATEASGWCLNFW